MIHTNRVGGRLGPDDPGVVQRFGGSGGVAGSRRSGGKIGPTSLVRHVVPHDDVEQERGVRAHLEFLKDQSLARVHSDISDRAVVVRDKKPM